MRSLRRLSMIPLYGLVRPQFVESISFSSDNVMKVTMLRVFIWPRYIALYLIGCHSPAAP